MKEEKIYSLAEAANNVSLTEEQVSNLLKEKIIEPSLLADENEVLFDEGDINQLKQIAAMLSIGYSLPDIKKIVRKVGFPKREKEKAKGGKPYRYLTVGMLANQTGINARTIKYWEERGIIEPDKRSEGGFRLYHEYYIFMCKLIRDLQLFGYSLEEIKEIADMFKGFYAIKTKQETGWSAEEVREKLTQMLAKVDSLNTRMKELGEGIERWKMILKDRQAEIKALKKTYSEEKSVAKVQEEPGTA